MQFGSSPASLQLGHHWFIIEMWNIDLILFLRHLMASSPLEIWSVSTYRAKGEGFKIFLNFIVSCQMIFIFLHFCIFMPSNFKFQELSLFSKPWDFHQSRKLAFLLFQVLCTCQQLFEASKIATGHFSERVTISRFTSLTVTIQLSLTMTMIPPQFLSAPPWGCQ